MKQETFSYLDCAWEILGLAEALPCGVGEAFDRFRSDVANGAAHSYNTAGRLPGFDFAEAKWAWDALSGDEQQAARDAWSAFSGGRRRVLRFLGLLRAGDRAAFDAALARWREGAARS